MYFNYNNFALLIFLLLLVKVSSDCNKRFFKDDQFVCVCNSTFCDSFPKLDIIDGYFQIFTTTKDDLGLRSQYLKFGEFEEANLTITLNKSQTYQEIIGFGGAFTDSTGINIRSLPIEVQDKLLKAYFGDDGLEYNMGRVPMGGTDFSIRGYSYDDVENDANLEYFKLQEEDLLYKIPIIKEAQKIRNGKQLLLFSSSWTAPVWMKTNHDWNGIGFLKREYYQVWANYFLKFFESYAEHGIHFWGVTTQNEPSDGFFFVPVNSLGFTMDSMKKWIQDYLGPTIRNSQFNQLKIIAHDDSRVLLPLTALLLLENPKTLEYVDGIGVHWYQDFMIPPQVLESVRIIPKDLFLLGTEACGGSTFVDGGVAMDIGSWRRAENYIQDIIQDLNFNVAGWLDWNMALDTTGGPSYVNNNVDAQILVNATTGEFYKQPMYYVMSHFSKFLIPGSKRVESNIKIINSENDKIEYVTFIRPDNITVIIIYNRSMDELKINISDGNLKSLAIPLSAKSLNTILYSGDLKN